MIVEVFIRVFFLIFTAALGWGAGYILKLSSRDISSLLIYVISPFVIFLSILQSPADWTYFRYSLVALLTASTAALLAYCLARMIWKDGRVNLFHLQQGQVIQGILHCLLLLHSLMSDKLLLRSLSSLVSISMNLPLDISSPQREHSKQQRV